MIKKIDMLGLKKVLFSPNGKREKKNTKCNRNNNNKIDPSHAKLERMPLFFKVETALLLGN